MSDHEAYFKAIDDIRSLIGKPTSDKSLRSFISELKEAPMTPKAQAKIRDVVDKLTLAYDANPAATGLLMAQVEKDAKRIVARATVPVDMERVTYTPTRGATFEFSGRVIYDHEHNGRSIELCETAGGNLVLFNEWTERGELLSQVYVSEGGNPIVIMDSLAWSDMAREMAKRLGWQTVIEVE